MADCVSLPNAAELVITLRNHAEYCDMPFTWMNEAYAQAADAIKALLAENEKLKAERDAAVALLEEESYCYSCKQCTERDGNECWCAAVGDWSEWYDGCEAWEWRGMQNDSCDSNSCGGVHWSVSDVQEG